MTDWTDFSRSNPELEATRARWNALDCERLGTTEAPSRAVRTAIQFMVCALVVGLVWAVLS